MTVVSEYVSEYCIWLVLRSGLEQLSGAGQLPFSVVDLNNTGVIVTGRLHTYLSSGTVLQSVFAIFLFNQLYSKRKLTDRLSFLKNYAIFYRAMMGKRGTNCRLVFACLFVSQAIRCYPAAALNTRHSSRKRYEIGPWMVAMER